MYCVLFVCSANICRSPTAEGVFRQIVTEADLGARIGADSVGLHRYHVGEPPDPRAVEAILGSDDGMLLFRSLVESAAAATVAA